ncbi:MAG: serine protease [Actinomycetia bacterium]|nr:serine protease [Actinomycetes bacterium]
MAPDEDDENEYRAPPPQEDRLWRHPSEVGAAARPVPAKATRSRPIGTILASGLSGALATTAILALGGSFALGGSRDDESTPPPPNTVVTAPPTSATPPTTTAEVEVLVATESDSGEEPAPTPTSATTTTTIRSFPPIDVREVREAITGVPERSAAEQVRLLTDFLSPAIASVISDGDQAEVIGAGLLVGSGDRMLTSHALVADLDPLTVTLANGTVASGRVSSYDLWTDLAIVDFDEPIGSPLVSEYARETQIGSGLVLVGPDQGPAVGRSRQIGQVYTVDSSLPANQGVDILGLMRTGDLTGPPGSPVFDDWGRLVGLVVGVGDLEGPRHVLPLDRHLDVVDNLIRHDNPGGGWLGVTGRSETNPAEGVLLVGIEAGGPADRGDLRDGDIIVSVTGEPVRSMAELKRELRRQDLDEAVSLGIYRDNRLQVIAVFLGRPVFNETGSEISPDPDGGTVRDDVPPGAGPIEPVDPLAATGT